MLCPYALTDVFSCFVCQQRALRLPRRVLTTAAASGPSPRRSLVATIDVFVTDTGELHAALRAGARSSRARRAASDAQTGQGLTRDVRASGSWSEPRSLGGCVLISGATDVTVEDVVVRGCRAEQGGGLAVVDSVSVRLVRVEATGNGLSNSTAKGGLAGGGAALMNVTEARIETSVFRGNRLESAGTGTVTMYGAGVYVTGCRGVEFVGETVEVSWNWVTASYSSEIAGGGLYVGQSVGVRLRARRVAIEGNRLNGSGVCFCALFSDRCQVE